MELIEYWYLLLRHKFIIGGSILLFAILGVTYALLATPIYQADAKLLFVEDDGMSSMMGGVGGDLMMSAIGKKADPLMTQIEIMKTRPVLQETIDSLHLVNDEGESLYPKNLRAILGYSVLTNTNIITLTCKNSDPKRAADIINTLSQIYINVNQGINREAASQARAFVDSQVILQKEVLDSAEDALAQYKIESGTISLKQETELKITGVSQLQAELIKVEAEMQGLKQEIAAYQKKVDAPGARNSSRYTNWKASLEQGKRTYATQQAYRNSLRRKIKSENHAINQLPAQEIRFANLLRDQEIAKQIYASLLESSNQFKIKEASNTSNIRVVEPAIIPEEPIEPQKKKIVMLALIAGFMLGFGIALLKEYLDDSPRSLEDIKRVLPFDSLGSVPYLNLKKVSPFYAKESSDSFAAESMRLVHMNLKFSGLNDGTNKTLMLTSSQPAEGKTTTSLNLAYTYATLGTNTCVVNLDLRRPAFSKLLDTELPLGVTDYLIGDCDLSGIENHYAENLTVISAGTTPPNPTALIGSKKMHELIDILRERYELVIFDTPPMLLVAETLDVARHMDGVIIVTDMVNSSMRALKDLGELLEGKDLPIMGTILNKMGKGEGYYYSAYHDE